jgi:hypothetical protein
MRIITIKLISYTYYVAGALTPNVVFVYIRHPFYTPVIYALRVCPPCNLD